MIFRDYLNGVASVLDARLQGYSQQKHSGDIGELCEYFIRDFLEDSLSGSFRTFRGGHVVDYLGHRSQQIDIVLCSRSAIKLFSDKGLYPVETVYGVVSVKKSLSHTNLFSDKPADCGAIVNLKSIPNADLKLRVPPIFDEKGIVSTFRRQFPYRIVFAYEGDISQSWEDELNRLAETEDPTLLPHLIVVNRKGLIHKASDKQHEFPDGETKPKYFNFTDISSPSEIWLPFTYMLSELHETQIWHSLISPDYMAYLNREFHGL